MVATVLLVAITVVLAGVLYIMLANLGSGATGPRPISLELTLAGNEEATPSGVAWGNFSLSSSQPLTTSEFGLSLVSAGGSPVPLGGGGCLTTSTSCSPSNSWIAFLYTPQGKVLNVWNSSGWSNSSMTVVSSMTLGLVGASGLHLLGSGDFVKVFSKAQPTVVGQSEPL